MKYMLLIYQGTTPLPGSDEWDSLSADEQRGVYAAYQSLNQTPGFTPADVQMQPPETATTSFNFEGTSVWPPESSPQATTDELGPNTVKRAVDETLLNRLEMFTR